MLSQFALTSGPRRRPFADGGFASSDAGDAADGAPCGPLAAVDGMTTPCHSCDRAAIIRTEFGGGRQPAYGHGFGPPPATPLDLSPSCVSVKCAGTTPTDSGNDPPFHFSSGRNVLE